MDRMSELFPEEPHDLSHHGGNNPSPTGGEVGPSRVVFADEVAPGMVIVSPDRCDGGGQCGLAATTHAAGKYHKFQVTRTRNVELGPHGMSAMFLIYNDEDGEAQAVGPIAPFGPMRVLIVLPDEELDLFGDVTAEAHRDR